MSVREGNLEPPQRHPIDWKNPDYYNEGSLFAELERVFDICHGCRRCISLCNAFPKLFDLVDEHLARAVEPAPSLPLHTPAAAPMPAPQPVASAPATAAATATPQAPASAAGG